MSIRAPNIQNAGKTVRKGVKDRLSASIDPRKEQIEQRASRAKIRDSPKPNLKKKRESVFGSLRSLSVGL